MTPSGAEAPPPGSPGVGPRPVRTRRARRGAVVAGAVVAAGGVAVGLVELLRLPRGSLWVVVGLTAALAAGIRALTRR